MAQKRYQLSAAAQSNTFYFVGGVWQFKVGYNHSTTGIHGATDCPVHAITALDVIAADEPWCQMCLEKAVIPGGIIVDGSPMGAGEAVFTDVTLSTVPGDVTLDIDVEQG